MFTKDTTPVKTETLLLYFSAHWCPPCRLLTPLLGQFYEGLRAEGIMGDKCEVVFVSSDRSEEQFKEYYATMPWGHLRFSEREEKNRLSTGSARFPGSLYWTGKAFRSPPMPGDL